MSKRSGSTPTTATPSMTAVNAGTTPGGSDRRDTEVERLAIGGRRKPEVREDRRFEGDDRSTVVGGVSDLGAELDH